MALHKVEDIRNIAFCGHGTAGKTTLVDKFLNKTGAVKRPASVDDRTSICDFDEEEKQHKYTIEASVVHFEHAGKHFNVIDTPGYPDFIGQTISALRAVDVAVIVINAHSGIGVNTRRVFKESAAAGLGRIIVINKMDTENIDFPKLLGSIRELFGAQCVPWNVPIGAGHDFKGVASVLHPPADVKGALVDPQSLSDKLLESIIEVDEEITAKYFEGEIPDDAKLADLAAHAVAAGTLIPVLCCAGKADLGVNELLDALALFAPSPNLVPRTATDAEGKEITLTSDPAGPLVAQVFKTRIDPFVQKLSFLRIYSGTLKNHDTVHASSARKGVKIAQLFRVQAHETQPIDIAGAGDIVALTKMEDLHTGGVLGDLHLPPIKFPTPMVGLAVTPKARGDEAKLSGALHKLVEEDPTFHTERDQQTHELVATGMSELHLQLLRERLKRRDKVEVESHEPKIPYRETIQANAEGSYRHKKQSGGRGQFGEVHIRMYPFPEGAKPEEFVTKERFPSMRTFHFDKDSNFLWVDSIVGGTIPNNFLPAVEKGFKERLGRGVIAGYKIKNVCVEVFFGKHHPVDSSEAAFKTAGSMAFRNVFQQAKPSLLEPIVTLHVTVPGDKLGDISSDMSGRRGRVLGMDSAGGDLQTVNAVVPLAEVTTYARSLSSITGGLGSYTMEFNHYDVVPGNIQKEIMDKAVMKEEEEESH
jgi:elongation factor G